MSTRYDYPSILAASEKVAWRVEDLVGGERRLDFGRPFLPEALARVEPLRFLTPAEQLALNQIRANGYLYTFGLVEELILPFVLDHVRPHLADDDHRVRAFLAFANEEAKHIHLFKRFRAEFEKGFGTPCGVIGPPEAVAQEVLSHHPLAVALAILHVEWMTQRHWIECARDDRGIDPMFADLLKHHWMEEAQHAKLDTLMVEALAEGLSDSEIARAVDEYVQIGGFLDEGLGQQVELDLASFARATGRRLDEDEEAEVRRVQRQAIRWTFLGSGMTHDAFLGTLQALRPASRERVADLAAAFC